MTSMTARLFGLLMLATTVVWACGMVWIYVGSQKELERVLDARLEEATRMVTSLMESAGVHVTNGVAGARVANQSVAIHQHEANFRLACQIWSVDGKLVGKSSDAPMTQLTSVNSGYTNQEINGTPWRVYAHVDPVLGIRVLVGDSISHRQRLVRDLMWGLALPGLFVLAALSGLLWLALREGLEPLRRMSATLAARSPDALEPLDIGRAPAEIRPVVDSMNSLFDKVAKAREHERSVTAFAAHELRTPLAGLRTQVQIALAASDATIRYNALRSALTAADRTTRMAGQLLAMAQVDATETRAPQEWINVGARLKGICDELRRSDTQPNVTIEAALYDCRIQVNPDAFHMVARNLTENAMQHSGGAGAVRWSMVVAEHALLLTLEDSGPGIPEDELALVRNRFFRGRHKSAIGSGLGLSIAHTALEKDGLDLHLENRAPEAGLRAQIAFAVERFVIDITVPDAGESQSDIARTG
ncbi:ATP-binding protein [Hyphomicrobium sulfonivorans]|uniref:ATP-binding protein n=1 Tax=Hyphomicrobium sulfonivorans TaxID=121290 RepID=UPI001570A54F|nr:ATP-binding protein [Hyphomicrobium sulfonivorans]MBI1648654.1 sensor histidine kinase N-terminal domain-containing protein [Hyphomicrobium sulfonivorans]